MDLCGKNFNSGNSRDTSLNSKLSDVSLKLPKIMICVIDKIFIDGRYFFW